MKYEDTATGRLYVGRSYAAIVKAMSKDKLTKARNRAAYRRGVATRLGRVGLQTEHSNDKVFVESLVRHGLLTER